MKQRFITYVALIAMTQAFADDARVVERVYKQTPQGELKLFIHFPPDWKASDRRPTIIFFFGGGWTSGTPTQFTPQAEYLASRGLVAVRADYRVKSRQNVTPDQCVEDAKSAVRWLRAHAKELGVDPNRLVAAGGSAGGHLAASTALVAGFEAKGEDLSVSSKPSALVLFNPVFDLVGVRAVVNDEGKDVTEAISPIRFVKKDTPPCIMFFGTADRLCEQGRAFLAKSKQAGNRAELYTAAELPHGFFNRAPWQDATVRQADMFLASLGYLSGAPTKAANASATLKREE